MMPPGMPQPPPDPESQMREQSAMIQQNNAAAERAQDVGSSVPAAALIKQRAMVNALRSPGYGQTSAEQQDTRFSTPSAYLGTR